MNSRIGIYNYDSSFYTGSKTQPDTMTLFVKSDKDKTPISSTKFPTSIWMGYVPIVSTFTGVAVIVNATKRIFHELSRLNLNQNDPNLSELWNAFKNMCRGLVQIVPVLGNISLIFFDAFKKSLYFIKIIKSLEGTENIAGVALDDHIIFQMDINVLKKLRESITTDEQCLNLLDAYCSKILELAEKKEKKMDLPDLLRKMPQLMNTINQ